MASNDYAGRREPRPLRRRSVSSPRIAPFSPFTPSLVHRSPLTTVVASPSATLIDSPSLGHIKAELFPADDDEIDHRPYTSHYPDHSAFFPRLRIKTIPGRTILACASVLLWTLTWYFLDRGPSLYTLLDPHTPGTRGPRYPNQTQPYYSSYLTPSAYTSFSVHDEDEHDTLPRSTLASNIDLSGIAFESYARKSSLIVVLACPSGNLMMTLPRLLYTLSSRYLSVGGQYTTILVCSSSQSRDALRIIERFTLRDAFVRVSPFEAMLMDDPTEQQRKRDLSLAHVAAQLRSEWVLILDVDTFASLPLSAITLLHHPPQSLHLPFGPRGVTVSSSSGARCISKPSAMGAPIPAAFLVPPFVVPTALLRRAESAIDSRTGLGVWASLGLRLAAVASSCAIEGDSLVGHGIGGLVVGADDPSSQKWCESAIEQASSSLDNEDSQPFEYIHSVLHTIDSNPTSIGDIAIVLPTLLELASFAPALCRMARHPHRLRVLIYGRQSGSSFNTHNGCHLHYDTLSMGSQDEETLEDWIVRSGSGSGVDVDLDLDVILAVAHDEGAKKAIELAIVVADEGRRPPFAPTVVVWPPVEDLKDMEWAGSMGIEEWRHWHDPKIDLVIITNDRPESLARLLRSVTSASYFSDTVSLHINLEQTADPETHEQVRALASQWTHGPLVVRHRVLLGGLLPAVVESWYPSSEDDFGLLLEDDVELSPMFYAWAKMNILKYRYGSASQQASRLFGISLYQQKSIELRPQGREPFSASALFTSHRLPHASNTPYLSQIPCSWGAIYFPSAWAQFHSFLIDRLSERTHDISTPIIAPRDSIRSNRWTKSWKKFFNEFVYLKGMVMLYPGFEDWVSLSTNHLEVGVHVRKIDDERESRKKKGLFELPLMRRASSSLRSSGEWSGGAEEGVDEEDGGRAVSLLDLPLEKLPEWDQLPVVDLWGHLSSEEEIVLRGIERYEQLMADCQSAMPLNGERPPMPLCRDTFQEAVEGVEPE